MKPHIKKLSTCWLAEGWGMVALGPNPALAYDKLMYYLKERIDHQRLTTERERNEIMARLRISGARAAP